MPYNGEAASNSRLNSYGAKCYHPYEVRNMIKTILFVIYAMLIPAVPLYGVRFYKKHHDFTKLVCCWMLFGIQALISIGSIISYINE